MVRADNGKECGPDWSLVGPGKAYETALAGKEPIRPPSGGDLFIHVHRQVGDRKETYTYEELQAALNNAVHGDVIEVRTDNDLGAGVFPKQGGDKKRGHITIRAAPGYQPSLDGLRIEEGNWVTVEGFHFRNGGLVCDMDEKGKGGHIVRVANCWFDGEPPKDGRLAHICGGYEPEVAKQPIEIVNCMTAAHVYFALPGQGKLVIRNSVIGGVSVDMAADSMAAVEIRRSMVCSDLYLDPELGNVAVKKSGRTEHLAVTVEESFVDTKYLLAVPKLNSIVSWTGSDSVHCTGRHNWLLVNGVEAWDADLANWLNRYKTEFKNCIVTDALLDDPRMWALTAGSPGHHGRPGGKDFGADVTLIGVTKPAAPPKK
jgi:hypothetical protein